MGNNNILYRRTPASWHMEPGRDATPLGNGKTGVLVHGGAGIEEIQFNRSDLWYRYEIMDLPNLDGALQEMRDKIDAGDYDGANDLMCDRLQEKGYFGRAGSPMILGCMTMQFEAQTLFSHYRRILDMEKAECEVAYDQKQKHVSRKCFVSREDDTFYYLFSATEETDVTISFGVFNDRTSKYKDIFDKISKNLTYTCAENGIDFLATMDAEEFGAKVRVFGADVTCENGALHLRGKSFRFAVKCASGKGSTKTLAAPTDFDYEEKLAAHAKLHGALYHSADLSLGSANDTFNEELLAQAFEEQADLELLEKMWRFGRYLFVSGTCEGGLPLPLYGLWHYCYAAPWAQNVANENVEIIYWHTVTGGLAKLVRPLIDYYCSHMDIFRENAEKLFGCKGIYIGTYSSPANLHLSMCVPVIVNFTGVAGWLSQHFYKYYRMTDDQEMLKEKIFPFMLEAAEFYLSYITYGPDGKVLYYPSVSPENTPTNLINEKTMKRAHYNPITKNATVEIAIIKELFTNLITLIEETGEHKDYLPRLTKVLGALPEYMINSDGALKEWTVEDLEDNYDHRCVHHIYPLYPGEEVSKEDDPTLYAAIEKAVDLRELGAQCGWSFAHVAAVYTVLGRGERALECLDMMLKSSTLNSLFTLHNDYRNMGITVNWLEAPVQLDANMGLVNALQKMLLDERRGTIILLPALPERLATVNVKDFAFTKGTVSMNWDLGKKQFAAKIVFVRPGTIKVKLPEEFDVTEISAENGTYEVNGQYVTLTAGEGATFTLQTK